MGMIADHAIHFARYPARRMREKASGFKFSRKWQNRVAIIIAICAIISGFATYAALTGAAPFDGNPNAVLWLLNIDLVLLMGLVALIAFRLVGVWSGRKRGLAGSHLHVRLVYIFSILAAIPVIVMTIFSAFFFHFGIQTWFSERVQTAVNESQAVAQAYLEEHNQVIRADALAMANDLGRQSSLLITNPPAFERIMRTQSILRNLSEAIIFNKRGEVLARSGLTFSLELQDIPQYQMRQVNDGEVVVMTGLQEDRVRALLRIGAFSDQYLFVGRMVDPQVLSHLDATQKAAEDYANLQSQYAGLQVTVTMIFVLVGLVMLLSAIWFGLLLARQLVSPISALITASDRVRGGDLSVRVSEEESVEEFEYLGRSFNRMTKQIQEQQSELIQTNRQLDERRRFTETVLSGVSSGVMGVNKDGIITLTNQSAIFYLGDDTNGQLITDIIPEIDALLDQAYSRPGKITQDHIPFISKEGARHEFLVKIAIDGGISNAKGAVITFDDISELQSAQRKAAWADVARRIAHEIKNPLTPIQLSAERLHRKYSDLIDQDRDVFSQCTNTIIKHVGDIERMVNEFSSFARMPEPKLESGYLPDHVQEVLVLQRQANPDIKLDFQFDTNAHLFALFDAQQIRQCLNNLIQNAADSIAIKSSKDEGKIQITAMQYQHDELALVISDNGVGLPEDESPQRLTEPYVTHKAKGTGLGLAIVKKIMEDHKGSILLETPKWVKENENWEDLGGATIILVMPCERQKLAA